MVKVELASKRYHCVLELKEKVTFIKGSSGIGKTELTRRLSSHTSANQITVSNGFEIVVLDVPRFYDFYRIALRHRQDNENEEAAVRRYWREAANFPYQNCIILVDDEDFIKTKAFSYFFSGGSRELLYIYQPSAYFQYQLFCGRGV